MKPDSPNLYVAFDICGHPFAVSPDPNNFSYMPAERVVEYLPEKKLEEALDIAVRYGGIDGDHHKTWVIDQIVRALTGDDYDNFIAAAKAGEDGPETYSWETGIAP
jgi:hypothetical protein